MKITLRDVGASSAVKAVESSGQLAHIRIGMTEADIKDERDWSNLTLEFADRATLETVLDNLLYAYGAPAFTPAEWLDIADYIELDANMDAHERAMHYAKQIRDAYGVKP